MAVTAFHEAPDDNPTQPERAVSVGEETVVMHRDHLSNKLTNLQVRETALMSEERRILRELQQVRLAIALLTTEIDDG